MFSATVPANRNARLQTLRQRDDEAPPVSGREYSVGPQVLEPHRRSAGLQSAPANIISVDFPEPEWRNHRHGFTGVNGKRDPPEDTVTAVVVETHLPRPAR